MYYGYDMTNIGFGGHRWGSYLGLMHPLEFITRCHGTLPLCHRALGLLASLLGEGRCLRQTPTCLSMH